MHKDLGIAALVIVFIIPIGALILAARRKSGFAPARFATLALSIFFGNAAYAAPDVGSPYDEKLQKFTPADLKVTPPGPDVPPECAKFSGQWGPGFVGHIAMATKVIFETITADCSATVVIVSAINHSFGNDPGAWAGRYDVKIVPGGAIEIQGVNQSNAVYVLKMNGTGTRLEGNTYKTLGKYIYFELSR